jgi:diguanylate cyclase (GGDEF)-like protein/putative nucleotidyltransferase with HDIG domain
MRKLSLMAKVFVTGVVVLGTSLLLSGLMDFRSADLLKFLCYLLIALLGSGLKVGEARSGSLPVSALFILIGLLDLSTAETLIVTCSAVLVQTLVQRHGLWQCWFQTASNAIAVAACQMAFATPAIQTDSRPVRLLLATFILFLVSTAPQAFVIALTEVSQLRKSWRETFLWSLPYYVGGAILAILYHSIAAALGWQMAMLVVPVLYLIYRSYGLYLGRIEAERKHAQEMSSLHMRTIEALALAIEAKDDTTAEHLERVQVYSLELGRELGLNERELEALRAASILHDIGKLAVPEHIISKPGRLTPEEFEKMKIHPLVGAEILERVAFPYPVVPIVRAHHEKWDGTGYPYGISGTEIPIGARILSAVDCLDALATDRQYRKALPLDEAMAVVRKDSGKAFDPEVVQVLERRYRELEVKAKARSASLMKMSTDIKIANGEAPAAGFEGSGGSRKATTASGSTNDFLTSIAAARHEAQALFEISQGLGNSLSLDENLSLLAVRLKRMVPYDSLAVYVKREDRLVPEYVSGENFRLFASLEIPIGQGLSGWVAENRKPIMNGNPSVEPGYLNDPNRFSTLRSATAVPLESPDGVIGVLAVYHADKDFYSRDHLRILLAIASKVGLSIENALRFRQAESTATTDYLTGLPNARSLFLHLDSEIARARRNGSTLSVLVTDLDGFKAVNDRFGHLEGNKVLKVVAQGFKDSCREYDYVARMGGDEFVLVLPGLRTADLHAKLARLSHLAVTAGREVVGEEVLGISVGRAQFPEDGADAETLLAEADKRMYRVKQAQKLAKKDTNRVRNFDWRSTVTLQEP